MSPLQAQAQAQAQAEAQIQAAEQAQAEDRHKGPENGSPSAPLAQDVSKGPLDREHLAALIRRSVLLRESLRERISGGEPKGPVLQGIAFWEARSQAQTQAQAHAQTQAQAQVQVQVQTEARSPFQSVARSPFLRADQGHGMGTLRGERGGEEEVHGKGAREKEEGEKEGKAEEEEEEEEEERFEEAQTRIEESETEDEFQEAPEWHDGSKATFGNDSASEVTEEEEGEEREDFGEGQVQEEEQGEGEEEATCSEGEATSEEENESDEGSEEQLAGTVRGEILAARTAQQAQACRMKAQEGEAEDEEVEKEEEEKEEEEEEDSDHGPFTSRTSCLTLSCFYAQGRVRSLNQHRVGAAPQDEAELDKEAQGTVPHPTSLVAGVPQGTFAPLPPPGTPLAQQTGVAVKAGEGDKILSVSVAPGFAFRGRNSLVGSESPASELRLRLRLWRSLRVFADPGPSASAGTAAGAGARVAATWQSSALWRGAVNLESVQLFSSSALALRYSRVAWLCGTTSTAQGHSLLEGAPDRGAGTEERALQNKREPEAAAVSAVLPSAEMSGERTRSLASGEGLPSEDCASKLTRGSSARFTNGAGGGEADYGADTEEGEDLGEGEREGEGGGVSEGSEWEEVDYETYEGEEEEEGGEEENSEEEAGMEGPRLTRQEVECRDIQANPGCFPLASLRRTGSTTSSTGLSPAAGRRGIKGIWGRQNVAAGDSHEAESQHVGDTPETWIPTLSSLARELEWDSTPPELASVPEWDSDTGTGRQLFQRSDCNPLLAALLPALERPRDSHGTPASGLEPRTETGDGNTGDPLRGLKGLAQHWRRGGRAQREEPQGQSPEPPFTGCMSAPPVQDSSPSPDYSQCYIAPCYSAQAYSAPGYSAQGYSAQGYSAQWYSSQCYSAQGFPSRGLTPVLEESDTSCCSQGEEASEVEQEEASEIEEEEGSEIDGEAGSETSEWTAAGNSEAEAETETEAEVEAEAETETWTEAEVEAGTEAETEAEPVTETETEPETGTEAEAEGQHGEAWEKGYTLQDNHQERVPIPQRRRSLASLSACFTGKLQGERTLSAVESPVQSLRRTLRAPAERPQRTPGSAVQSLWRSMRSRTQSDASWNQMGGSLSSDSDWLLAVLVPPVRKEHGGEYSSSESLGQGKGIPGEGLTCLPRPRLAENDRRARGSLCNPCVGAGNVYSESDASLDTQEGGWTTEEEEKGGGRLNLVDPYYHPSTPPSLRPVAMLDDVERDLAMVEKALGTGHIRSIEKAAAALRAWIHSPGGRSARRTQSPHLSGDLSTISSSLSSSSSSGSESGSSVGGEEVGLPAWWIPMDDFVHGINTCEKVTFVPLADPQGGTVV